MAKPRSPVKPFAPPPLSPNRRIRPGRAAVDVRGNAAETRGTQAAKRLESAFVALSAGVAELADARDSKSRGPAPQVSSEAGPYETSLERLGVLLGAFAAEIAPVAPDLADLLTAWPTLPEPITAGIVAMVKAVAPADGKRP